MSSIKPLRNFILDSKGRCLVLTGAGISTDSGIPDYRGPSGIYVRNPDYKPIRYQEFFGSHERRQKYWARSFLGWPKIEHAKSNDSHKILHELEQNQLFHGLITQNVDGLHLSKNLLELHGTLHQVHCLNCGHQEKRSKFQVQLAKLNPIMHRWAQKNKDKMDRDVASSMNPDGDVEIKWDYSQFLYPDCPKCENGILKPSVVFFGENIHHEIKDKSFDMIENSSSLLVMTSSLQVYSALRLVKRAHELNIPIAIVNIGVTRGDSYASIKISEPIMNVLKELKNYFLTINSV